MSDDRINGMRLPSQLMAALSDKSWSTQGKYWQTVFSAGEAVMPSLNSLGLMRRENKSWREETEPAFLGMTDGHTTPGILDPTRSVLIGELQPDAMIALDYRNGEEGPSVVYLNMEGRWVQVAEGFDEFWRRLIGT